MAKTFGSAAAFKASLEAHLRRRARELAIPFDTLRVKFVMERLLARLFRDESAPWLLKGGFAMDLRFRPRARTTKDVDLTVPLVTAGPAAAAMRDRLQAAAAADLGDYLAFRIGPPKKELTNAPGGGSRFPCEGVLVGKVYAAFHLDVGVGDAVVGEPERLVGDDLLAFAGIPPAAALAIPRAQQFAEKAHAYTFPWVGRVNTRAKDLVDLMLLIERGVPDAAAIRVALAATFAARGSHPLPAELPAPPAAWAVDFPPMAAEAGISTGDYRVAFTLLDRFWRDNALGAA